MKKLSMVNSQIMKNNKISFIALAICMAFLSLSCQKEKLPKLTHEGKNTFGCKINGKNWVPKGGGGLLNPIDALRGGFWYNKNTIYIWTNNDSERVELYVKNVFSTGEYGLNTKTLPMPDNLYPDSYGLYSNGNDNYVTTSAHTGKVTISNRDTVNSIVSGTFEFTAVNSAGKTVKITDGRFDIKTH